MGSSSVQFLTGPIFAGMMHLPIHRHRFRPLRRRISQFKSSMNIPASSRRRALAIIDVQSEFVSPDERAPLFNIKSLIASFPYDLYVEAVFSAEPDSVWGLQTGWSLPAGKGVGSVEEIARALQDRHLYHIHKHTKSAFQGHPDLLDILQRHEISELHLVGFDLNDCIMASAFDAFDSGLFTYVIEECCGQSRGSDLRTPAINLLRYLNLTNNSIYESIPVLAVPSTGRALRTERSA
jgi:nicotinamidase-related amidase